MQVWRRGGGKVGVEGIGGAECGMQKKHKQFMKCHY
jgi:hypothetical protein